jgi:hypothetical protein
VALVLLALVVGPLYETLHGMRQRAASVRALGAGLVTDGVSDLSWGPAVSAARWEAGQTLVVAALSPAETGVALGLWADGWFLGEFEFGADEAFSVRVSSLGAHAGAELVARLRVDAGTWGPPARTLVPDSFGPAEQIMTGVEVGPQPDAPGPFAVVHTPALASPFIQASDDGVRAWTDASGLPVFLSCPGLGVAGVRLGTLEQRWKAEERRELDLYY